MKYTRQSVERVQWHHTPRIQLRRAIIQQASSLYVDTPADDYLHIISETLSPQRPYHIRAILRLKSIMFDADNGFIVSMLTPLTGCQPDIDTLVWSGTTLARLAGE